MTRDGSRLFDAPAGELLIGPDHSDNGTIGRVYEYEGASSRTASIGVRSPRALCRLSSDCACGTTEQQCQT
jgi:hypothetical protein